MMEKVLSYQNNDVIYHSIMKCLGLEESEKFLNFKIDFFSNRTYIEKLNLPNFETHVED
jgi:hypothetical protein